MAERIGDFLLRIKAIKPEQVQEVLRIQKAGDKRLFGEIALELGYIDDNSVKRFLDFLDSQRSPGSAGLKREG